MGQSAPNLFFSYVSYALLFLFFLLLFALCALIVWGPGVHPTAVIFHAGIFMFKGSTAHMHTHTHVVGLYPRAVGCYRLWEKKKKSVGIINLKRGIGAYIP